MPRLAAAARSRSSAWVLTGAAWSCLVACATAQSDGVPDVSAAAGRSAGGSGSVALPPSGSVAGAFGSGASTQAAAGAPSFGGSSAGAGTSGVLGVAAGGSSGALGVGGGGTPTFQSGQCAANPTFSLQYKQGSTSQKQITAQYQFMNASDTPVSLAQLKIWYLFSNEETSGWNTAVYDAKLEGGAAGYRPIAGSALQVVALSSALPGADSYIELSFPGSTLTIEKGATATVNWDLQPKSYNPPDQVQTDDYSYNAADTVFTPWDHVVIYQGAELVAGCLPKAAEGNGGASGGGGGGGGALSGLSGSNGTGGGAASGGSAGSGGAASGFAGSGGRGAGGASAGSGGASGVAGTASGGAAGVSGRGATGNAGKGGA